MCSYGRQILCGYKDVGYTALEVGIWSDFRIRCWVYYYRAEYVNKIWKVENKCCVKGCKKEGCCNLYFIVRAADLKASHEFK